MIKKITVSIVRGLVCLKIPKAESLKLKAKGSINPSFVRVSKLLFVGMLLAFLSFFAHAQIQERSSPAVQLMVGDKLPEAFWKQEHRFLSKGKIVTATLERFKGKVILIDFWASWCSSCRTAIPLLDSLSRLFPEQLVAVPVVTQSCNDKIAQIDQALKDALGAAYASTPPGIVEDLYLDALFPHRYLSHYILIGRHGRISAYLAPELITAETIKQVIDQTHPPKKRNEKTK